MNPPDARKYCHWTNTRLAKSAETWLNGAKEAPGSWWPEWQRWIARKSGGKVDARIPGDGGLPVVEDAPGSYVAVRSTDG